MRLLLVAVLLSGGCAAEELQYLKSASVGHTGCLENEMTISNASDDLSTAYWVVQCRGRTFLCSRAGRDIGCHERI